MAHAWSPHRRTASNNAGWGSEEQLGDYDSFAVIPALRRVRLDDSWGPLPTLQHLYSSRILQQRWTQGTKEQRFTAWQPSHSPWFVVWGFEKQRRRRKWVFSVWRRVRRQVSEEHLTRGDVETSVQLWESLGLITRRWWKNLMAPEALDIR